MCHKTKPNQTKHQNILSSTFPSPATLTITLLGTILFSLCGYVLQKSPKVSLMH